MKIEVSSIKDIIFINYHRK